MERDFLPISRADMKARGWDQCDFVYVIGDAYVDHPSFGHAIISRVLEDNGYKVGIISQPDWKNPASINILGEPRLGFLVMGGNMDSMVNHYSVTKKRRKTDAFTPGGVIGKRPDHATTVYCNLIRRTYPTKPIIVGGIEASLRRLGHYDYWSDSMKRSLLLDSQANLLLYGMGERSIVEVADALNGGLDINDITFIRGSVYKTTNLNNVEDYLTLPSFEDIASNRRTYARSFYTQYCNTDPFSAKTLVEPYEKGKCYLIQNPPQMPLKTKEMDHIYALPYMRTYHPSYEKAGGVPAIEEVKFSLISSRGCFGGCSFCALTFHQGRIIQTRSHDSIIEEAKLLIADPDFKGYIHDVGGPTANFRHTSCDKQKTKGVCPTRQCLFPTPCKNLRVDHRDYLTLLRKLRKLPGVKKVFIRSGIRFDYLIYDKDESFLREMVEHHVSGQLKVAPEHIADPVLQMMGKPSNEVYKRFLTKYQRLNEKLGKKQFVVPYLMSSHPGSTLNEAIALAEYLRDLGYMPEQVQDFYPTPSTISTVMYYTGLDPRTMKPVYVATDPHEKAMQRALIQYRNPKNYHLVREALEKADREDLIGFGNKCLIRPPGSHKHPGGQRHAPTGKPTKQAGSKKPAPKNDRNSSSGGRSGRQGKNTKTTPNRNTKPQSNSRGSQNRGKPNSKRGKR
ncbi:MAG: YgiQ family radical SAM protein [Ruminococcaceae bacterium]|nr:YgiQ family radical SAM protein [Oscillospiraceae bacterium]